MIKALDKWSERVGDWHDKDEDLGVSRGNRDIEINNYVPRV